MINIALTGKEKLLGIDLPSFAKRSTDFTFHTISNSIWDILNKVREKNIPDINIVLIHLYRLSLKELSGIKFLHDNYPDIKIIGFSYHPDLHLIRLTISMGASAYCCLNDNDNILEHTIRETCKNGQVLNQYVKKEFFSEDFDPYATSLINSGKIISKIEAQLLALIPTDYTYKQIADIVKLSPKTVDRHREILFQKLNIKSRQGLTLFAIKYGFFNIK